MPTPQAVSDSFFVVSQSHFPLFVCIIKMAAARIDDVERIGRETACLKVVKEPESKKQEDNEQFCGRKLYCVWM